jgi:hypothetical protein
MGLLYTGQVRLNWKIVWLAMLTFVALLGAGCSGINVGGSISPASFFLPGVMADPSPEAAPAPVAAAAPSLQFAQAR